MVTVAAGGTEGVNDGNFVTLSVLALPVLRPAGEVIPANNIREPVIGLGAVVVPG